MKQPQRPFTAISPAAARTLLLMWFGGSLAACAGDRLSTADSWDGTVDTLPNGAILVHNPGYGIWDSTTAWHVEEELRIGTLEGSGPDLFGSIAALEADNAGRFYVLESQAQEVRVFDSSGRHVRTVGREGGGPGEFRQATGMAWSPNGDLWVVDPGNLRISVFDTSGAYLAMHRILGGYVMVPWPGGFDEAGRLYHYGLDLAADPRDRFVMVRFDTLMSPLDTVRIPRAPDAGFFELRTEGGFMRAGIPFSAGITWRLAATGHLWFANTGDYRIYKRAATGDTLLIVSRDFEPLPLTGPEIDSAIVELDWFTQQGGRIDRSKFPSVKPALTTVFVDGEDRIWVAPVVTAADRGRLLDVFDPSGRYLGRVRLPFRLLSEPFPLFRGDNIYAVTRDEFEVPYVVRSKIVRP